MHLVNDCFYNVGYGIKIEFQSLELLASLGGCFAEYEKNCARNNDNTNDNLDDTTHFGSDATAHVSNTVTTGTGYISDCK